MHVLKTNIRPADDYHRRRERQASALNHWDDLNQVYFYKNNLNWFAENGRGTNLGGPFSTYDGLLRWAVEKEFVEPTSTELDDED